MRIRQWGWPVLLALLVPGAHADVIHVAPGAGSVQGAVDSARPGDVILLAPGDYGETVTIAGKALTLVGDGGIAALERLTVRDVVAGQTVVLRGLRLRPALTPAPSWNGALELLDIDGHVRVEDCSIEGNGWKGPQGCAGAWVQGCHSVVLARCDLMGAKDHAPGQIPVAGGSGLELTWSVVVAFDCDIEGGRGADATFGPTPWYGGEGGSGVLNGAGGVLHLDGCVLTGGDGGWGAWHEDCTVSYDGGSGGDGLRQFDGSAASSIRSVVAQGGAQGFTLPSPCGDAGGGPEALPGQGLHVLAGAFVQYPATQRGFAASSPVREGEHLLLTLTVLPGDAALVLVSLAPAHAGMPGRQGVLLVDAGALLTVLAVSVPPGGWTIGLRVNVF
jgi:hypothetical protein